MRKTLARLSTQKKVRCSRPLAPLPLSFPGMFRPAHLAENLRRPLPTKDGGVLRTVADAANYMVALPDDRRLAHWQRAAQLFLDGADAAEISRQIELALFYDRKLDLKASKADIAGPAPEQSDERAE